MKVLVTGSNGFLGSAIVNNLENNKIDVISLVRDKGQADIKDRTVLMTNFQSKTEWMNILAGIDVVVHLIARTHNTSEKDANTYQLYHDTNVGITETLCDSILASDVKKLIFLSSIKVNGERTLGIPFNENSPAKPEDNYGRTKLKAEELIRSKFEGSHKNFIIIRSPLIYGKKVKGNLETLLKVIRKKIPLPFKCTRNTRSIVSLEALALFITLCIRENWIRDELFMVSDTHAYSTYELIERIAKDNAENCVQFCVPKIILNAILKAIGKQDLSNKLLCDLQIDNSKAVRFAEKSGAIGIFN